VLADYAGTVLLISHDRDFLDRIVTSVIAFEGAGRWIDYAGGYSDMLRQRGTPLAAEPERVREKPVPKPSPAAPPPRQRKKLTFADQHALKVLPERIDELAAELRRLEKELSAPDLYRKNPAAFSEATMALANTRAALTAAEEEWLAVELRREEIEGAAES